MRRAIPAFAVFVVVLAVFSSVRHNDFVNYDDPAYITENPHVLAGLTAGGARWAFTTFEDGNWFPLTWLSHMADVSLFGLDPSGHHLTNAVLHALSASILFLLLTSLGLTTPVGLIATGLFALHPLRVESVAWVAERKDVLSSLLTLATLIAYVGYTRAPGLLRQVVVASLFACALMAKAMPVTLPFVMLLLDYWPLGRWPGLSWARLVREKALLLAMSIAASVIAFVAQSSAGATASLTALSLGARIANALISSVDYLGDFFWPSGLAVFYPREPLSMAALAIAAVILLVISWLVWSQRARRPYLFVGWLWFVGMLVPVIGLVQIGSQARADRYTYLPMIGISLAVACLLESVWRHWPRRRWLVWAAASAGIGLCAVATVEQIRVWRDSVTLFAHARQHTRPNYTTLNNLGQALASRDDFTAAFEAFTQAFALAPADPSAHINFATALNRAGLVDRAIAEYAEAVRLDPASSPAHAGLGAALARQGKLKEAANVLAEAVRLDPRNHDAHYNLASVLMRSGRLPEAVAHLAESVRLNGSDAQLRSDLGAALATLGRYDEAIREFEAALRLDASLEQTRRNLEYARELKARSAGK